MKRILFLFLLMLLASGIYAQSFNVVGGRTTVLTWTEQGNDTAYTFLFVVKTDRQLSSPRIIQKDVTSTYYKSHTVATCTLNVDDTDDLTTNAFYYYDVVGYGVDTITFASGRLNIYAPTQTSFDGSAIAEGVRVTTVALDNGTLQDETIAWDTTLARWAPSGVTYQSAEAETFFQLIEDSLGQPLKKIYGTITNGSVTTWNIYGFSSDATNVISGDTLIITDASGELNLEGIVSSNNYDFTIVGTPTVYQLKVEWGGFTGKTISFVWQLDTLSNAFPMYAGTSNTYNYSTDTTLLDLKANIASPTFTGTVKLPSSIYINNGITDVALAPSINELNYVDGVTSAIQTQLNAKASTAITDSLASDIANIADSNFVLTSETSTWDKTSSDDLVKADSTIYATQYDISSLVVSLPDSIIYTSEIAGKAPLASPTFTGAVTLPTSINIGETVLAPSVIELNYVDGVTSAIQTQLNNKLDTTKVNNLIETNEDTSGTAIIGTVATLDSIITDYWNDALGSGLDSADVSSLISDSLASFNSADSTVFATKYYVDTEITQILDAGDVRVPFMWAYLQLDTTGSVSSIPDVTDIAISTLTESDTFGVSANDVARVDVDSGAYKVRYDLGGTPTWTGWLTSEAYYKDVDSAIVRHTSSGTNSQTTLQRFYVSNDVDTFSVTTVASGGGGGLTPRLNLIWNDSITYSGSRTVTSWVDNGWAFTDDTSSGNKVIRTDSSVYFNNAVLALNDAAGNPFDFGDTSFTVALWMWMDTTTSGGAGNSKTILEKDAGGAPSWKLTNTNADAFNEFSITASNGVDTTASHRSATGIAGSWKHIVSVYEKGVNHRIYIDSVLTNGSYNGTAWANLSAINYNNSEPAKIGSTVGSGQHIKGIKIYWEALTSAEVKTLFEEGRP